MSDSPSRSFPQVFFSTRRPFQMSTLSCLLLAVACGGSTGAGRNAKEGKCEPPKSVAPTLPPLSDESFPTSELWVLGQVPLSAISDRIAQEVPSRLAAEKDRPVGAPGKATYTVTRGKPKLTLRGDRLEVQVPISADISVCKPIGGICLRYGSCAPELLARFSVATELGENFEFPPPKGSIAAKKGCVIGLDVTPQIEQIAKKEVSKVERQIAAQWPRLLPEVQAAMTRVTEPVEVEQGRCIQAQPEQLLYQKPTIEKNDQGRFLTAAFGMRGVIMTSDCTPNEGAPIPPKPTIMDASAPTSTLWYPEEVSWETVKMQLADSIAQGSSADITIEVLEAKFSKSSIALQLRAEGPVCGTFWITASLAPREATPTVLGLRAVTLVRAPGSPAKLAPSSWNTVKKHLESVAKVVVSGPPPLGENTEVLLRLALKDVLNQGVDFSMTPPQVGEASVVGARDSLQLAYPISATIIVTDI